MSSSSHFVRGCFDLGLRGSLVLVALSGAYLSACAARHARVKHPHAALEIPKELDQASFERLERAYFRLDPDDPQRADVRERLVGHVLTQAERTHVADEYDASVQKLAVITSLFRPEELAKGLPKELYPLADYIRKEGERRGDEARVLSALWIEMQLHPDDPSRKQQYQMLRRWSDEARQNLEGVTEHLNGLINVMAEHARLTPAPDVLATLADLYTERRRKLVEVIGPEGEPERPGELTYQDYREATQALNRAPLDIAGVYLAHEDFTRALERLRGLETVTGLEPRIRTWVERASDDAGDAPVALLAVSRLYLEAGEADVAHALCLHGVRKFREDASFPQCLARLAALEDDYSEATADYADAIKLAPDQRELYDEALEVLANLMRGEMFDSDPRETRQLADEARVILDERVRRWPEVAPPVSLEDLELAVGLAEMSAGNADEARAHFEASLKKKETTRALVQLGQLDSRLGKLDEAAAYLRKALDRTSVRDAEEARLRAQILEQIGDVQRTKHELDTAKRTYAEALALWEGAAQGAEDAPQRAFAHIRRGVLLSRLGRDAEAASAFEAAMVAAPDNRETYAQILAHLVVSTPNPELADAILRRAQRQLTLDPEWKSYFALWVKGIASRAHAPASRDVSQLLARLARSDAWWGHLAQFGQGSIDYKRLGELATSRGEHTEADFYEGLRRLGAGNLDGARELFRKVIESRMVGFYEYQMAQELLELDDARLLPPAPAASVPAAPSPTAAVKPKSTK